MVDQNEDEDDHEMNDGEVDCLTKSSSASCSCTPPRDGNTEIMISQVLAKLRSYIEFGNLFK